MMFVGSKGFSLSFFHRKPNTLLRDSTTSIFRFLRIWLLLACKIKPKCCRTLPTRYSILYPFCTTSNMLAGEEVDQNRENVRENQRTKASTSQPDPTSCDETFLSSPRIVQHIKQIFLASLDVSTLLCCVKGFEKKGSESCPSSRDSVGLVMWIIA